jgi:hypothetical protein
MDDCDAMYRAAKRGPQKLQSGGGYARGGRVAMDRALGKLPAGAEVEVAHIDVPLPRAMKGPVAPRLAMPPMRKR